MGLRIAARKSDLARLQAYMVGEKLESLGHSAEYYFRQSLGDQNQEDPLWKMPEKGVFTEDFREGLIKGEFSMVVHSWKDLPVEIPGETEIVATLPRADARDLFLFKKNQYEKVKKNRQLKVFSSSPRRNYIGGSFLKQSLPFGDIRIEFVDVRGNIQTRLTKLLENDQVDGLMVAKAAIDRLLLAQGEEFDEGRVFIEQALRQCLWQVLPLKENPTAAAQGALAIEVRRDDKTLKDILAQLNCQQTWNDVCKERQILKSHGGGCHQKIGVSLWSRSYGQMQSLKGETEQGLKLDDYEFSGPSIELQRPLKELPRLFKRKPIAYQQPLGNFAHFIARSEALPEDNALSDDDILWVSGSKTWFKLAQRGYWVSGCSESMGEHEDQKLQALIGEVSWLKWTHDESQASSTARQVATYSLEPVDCDFPWDDYEEFFWMSASQFARALQLKPDLINKKHFCGPGHTFPLISEMLESQGIKTPPTILPSYQVWLQLIKE